MNALAEIVTTGSLDSDSVQHFGNSASSSVAPSSVLDFISSMVSAGRVTVHPAFALRLLGHLSHKALDQRDVGSDGRAKGEERVMQLIRAIGVERLTGPEQRDPDRLSIQVNSRGGGPGRIVTPGKVFMGRKIRLDCCPR